MARILTVDDMDLERLNIVTILKKAGHTVIEARNGLEALEVAEKEQPDAIFMDIVMPGLDGFGATKRMKQNKKTAHIPIIIVSSKNQESDRFRATHLGAHGYVTKPAQSEQILEILEDILQ